MTCFFGNIASKCALKVPENRTTTIGADFLFTAINPVGCSAPLTAHELELYRRKSEGLIRVTPRIEALAAELSSNCASAQEAVEAFWTYMMGTLCSGMIRYCDIPPDAPGDSVLDNGWYDCQLGSALLTSLCRAQGLPARLVSGHFLLSGAAHKPLLVGNLARRHWLVPVRRHMLGSFQGRPG